MLFSWMPNLLLGTIGKSRGPEKKIILKYPNVNGAIKRLFLLTTFSKTILMSKYMD